MIIYIRMVLYLKKTAVFLISLFILLSACNKTDQTANSSAAPSASTSVAESSAREPVPNPLVPDFELTDSNGNTVSLSDYAGKVVVLNFWASWCPPCRAEMPDFDKLHTELTQSDDTVLLMINQTYGRETKESADAFYAENQFSFPHYYDEGEVGYQIFGVQSLPTTVVIDAEQRLSGYVLGQTNYDTVAAMIEEAKNAQPTGS